MIANPTYLTNLNPKKKHWWWGQGCREGSDGGREGGRKGERERPSTRWCSDTFLKTPFCLWFVVCKSSGLLALRLLPPEKKNTVKYKTIQTNTATANERERERERERESERQSSETLDQLRTQILHLLSSRVSPHRNELTSCQLQCP
jgi:hypothetical protein